MKDAIQLARSLAPAAVLCGLVCPGPRREIRASSGRLELCAPVGRCVCLHRTYVWSIKYHKIYHKI